MIFNMNEKQTEKYIEAITAFNLVLLEIVNELPDVSEIKQTERYQRAYNKVLEALPGPGPGLFQKEADAWHEYFNKYHVADARK